MSDPLSQSSGDLWVNLYEITNLGDLDIAYRLLRVEGVPADEQFDRNVGLLVGGLAYEMRQPVARVRRGNQQYVAVPANCALPKLQRQLVPHAVDLVPDQETHELNLGRLNDDEVPVARAFLQFAVRTPLYRDRAFWQSGRAWFRKQPRAGDGRATIDIYDGFRVALVVTEDKRAFLAIDLATAYVDRLWLPQRLNGGDFGPYRGRRALYHYGDNWYVVQLAGLPGKSIAEQTFVLDDGRRTSVLAYTREHWPHDPQVARLGSASPAVVYRSVGTERERYAALALCKLSYTTQHPEVAGLHRASIVDPTPRFARASDVVRRHFQSVQLAGRPIHVSDSPLRVQRRVFAFPPQRFAQGRVLGTSPDGGVTEVVRLDQIGRKRRETLLDPHSGALDRTPFDVQYAILPQGFPRGIAEDFVQRFHMEMRAVSGQKGYVAKTIVYDDARAPSLYRQLEAVDKGLQVSGVRRGYGLLVLPAGAHADLHHQIKHRHWPDLQLQCANAAKIRSYYEEPTPGAFRVRGDMDGKLASYVRNVALGMLCANRKWPWALADSLHYEVYVGIDVLNRIAGITCVFGGGSAIVFRDYPSVQPERLTQAQTRQMLLESLGAGLRERYLHPKSIVIHRDGRSFASERRGLHSAVRELINDGVLPIDVCVGIVEVHKTSSERLRLAEGGDERSLRNPTVGSYFVLGPRSGIVATTGAPFQFPGTADPLALEIVEGDLEIERVLEDTYDLSTLIYSAPDKCGRLPVTIRLADELLEPIAGADQNDEAAMYDVSEQDQDFALAAEEELTGASNEGGRAHE